MKRKSLLVSILLIFGLMLVACGGTEEVVEPVVEEAAPVVEEAAEVVEEPPEVVEEATEVVVEEVEEVVEEPIVEEADLDEAFTVFLDDMEAYNTVGIETLNEMMIDGEVYILDVRAPSELEENGWIEGAVNIPLRDLADSIEYLPAEDTTIVSYCGSGWRCTIALTALEGMGWDDVLGLKGGSYAGWVEAGYPIAEGALPELVALDGFVPETAVVTEMQEMLHAVPDGYGGITAEALETEIIENPDLILIDVRRAEEVDGKGYIDAENVLFIPLEEFVANGDQWPADLDAPIVVYCGSGHRSTIGMSILWANGYTDVRSLKGGYGGWVGGGYPAIGAPEPVADLDGAYGEFIADMEGYNALKDYAQLNEWLAEDVPPFLLDVRNPAELEEFGHIEGAVNIPLRELAQNIDLLPDFDVHIVTYCKGGWRAAIAMTILGGMGYTDVQALHSPSYTGWAEAGYATVDGLALDPMVLEIANPDPAMVELLDGVLVEYPDNWGGISADDLAVEIVDNPDLILMDVRTPGEVETSVIDAPNLTWAMLDDFINLQDQWPEDLDAPIVTYCKAGHRSTVAMTILRAYGYTNVRSLSGGFVGWETAEYPVAEYATP